MANRFSIAEPFRYCARCERFFPATTDYFHKSPRKVGLQSVCKSCSNIYSAAYQLLYSKRLKKSKQQYYKDHADTIKARVRNYIPKDQERFAEAQRVRTQRRLARKHCLPDTLTKEEWKQALDYWHYACAICGNEQGFFWRLSMDHWIPTTVSACPGTIARNILPLCFGNGGCNNSKGNKNPIEWLTEKLGPRKAKQKLREIETYFTLVRTRETQVSSA